MCAAYEAKEIVQGFIIEVALWRKQKNHAIERRKRCL